MARYESTLYKHWFSRLQWKVSSSSKYHCSVSCCKFVFNSKFAPWQYSSRSLRHNFDIEKKINKIVLSKFWYLFQLCFIELKTKKTFAVFCAKALYWFCSEWNELTYSSATNFTIAHLSNKNQQQEHYLNNTTKNVIAEPRF